ncbi:hypothetical protein B566_EDAN003027 [Ephemera danica]|nr:hypothetical protein B566_EDAN003027 [Ephemera danica]
MALLGVQLVITMVMASILQKLGPHYSLGRWILCSTGLTRYLYPTDDELKTLAGIPREGKAKGKKGRNAENGISSKDTFHVPRNLDLQLETAKVSALDVVHLRYYAEYQWLLDFAVYSSLVYILTEVYYAVFPVRNEVNLSMLWCLLVIGFAFKVLVQLTVQYFRSDESIGERSMCIVAAFGYLLVAMMVLIMDESRLELGLDKAYASFQSSAAEWLQNQGVDTSGPASKLILKLCFAVWCGLIGSLFTFPGLRMAKMHWDSLSYCSERPLMRLLLNVSFASPFLLTLLWVRPIARDYLAVRLFSGMTTPLMTEAQFDSARLLLVIGAVVLRLLLMPIYLQAYLNMAHHRLEEQKKEAGRITNKELQKKIAAVFYYLCVVTLQYIAPILMCLYLSCMLKTLGGYTWTGVELEEPECSMSDAPPVVAAIAGEDLSPQEVTLALSSLKQVFTTDVFRGVLGFSSWWCLFTWFSSASLGALYQSYFGRGL